MNIYNREKILRIIFTQDPSN